MKQKYYITTAIAYTSSKPHVGNTYEAVLADAMARFPMLANQGAGAGFDHALPPAGTNGGAFAQCHSLQQYTRSTDAVSFARSTVSAAG